MNKNIAVKPKAKYLGKMSKFITLNGEFEFSDTEYCDLYRYSCPACGAQHHIGANVCQCGQKILLSSSLRATNTHQKDI